MTAVKQVIAILTIGVFVLVVVVVLLIFRSHSQPLYNDQNSDPNINLNNDTMPKHHADFPPPVETAKLFPEGKRPGYIVVPMGSAWVKVNDNWQIRLDSVLGDGRCPKGVTCVTAGIAIAKVQFRQPGVDYHKAYFEEMKVNGLNRYPPTNELKPSLFLTVHIYGKSSVDGKEVSFDVALADLIPYPKQGEDGTKNYVALFRIMRE